jgi:hypothetical protein
VNLKTILLGALLIAPFVARSQQAVLLTSTFDVGAVSAKGSGNALRGSIGEPVSGLVTRGGGVVNQSGIFSFLAMGGYVTSAGVEERPVPLVFFLWQNYPNPFNPSTTIRFDLPHASKVTLKVYNVLGQEVTTLVEEEKPAGTYDVQFSAQNLASGMYVYRIHAGQFVQTRKLLLLR